MRTSRSEDDLEHRQTLVVDERAVDDRRNTLGLAGAIIIEAEQAVDLVLVEDAVSTGAATAAAFLLVVVVQALPLGSEAFFF